MRGNWIHILRLRLLIGALIAVVLAFSLPPILSAESRVAIGWIAYIGTNLFIIFRTVGGRAAEDLRTWATRADFSAVNFALFLVVSASISVVASVMVLREADNQVELWRYLHLALGASTVLTTWFAVQAAFAVRYTKMYYSGRHGGLERGLRFPGGLDPDFYDFLYFSTCAGMTFEASDVAVTHRHFRHWLTFQAVFSFVFTTVNLALLVDIAANLI